MAANQPPSYTASIRTVHDETHRGIWHPSPCVASLGNRPNLLAYLEHHAPSSDGSFSICVAGGSGVFISKDLYESIPSEHRPALNEADAGTEISLQIMGGSMTALGTTYLPFLLTDDTNQRVRVVLHTYVVPRLLMGMFLGTSSLSFDLTTQFGRGGPTFIAKFGQESCRFVGM